LKLLEQLERRLRVALQRDWEMRLGGRRALSPEQEVVIIAPRPIPTLDYYLQGLKSAAGRPARVVFDADLASWQGAEAPQRIAPQTLVVLVRMPNPAWAPLLRAADSSLAQVVWLIDDDVLAARDDASLPLDYRLRLLSDYARFRNAFASLIDRVWVSTPALAARFPPEKVELRPPQPLSLPRKRWIKAFYHGSGAHRAEQEFLLPIFSAVQELTDNVVLEVVGDHSVQRLFRSVPRLRVVHPMRWPDYLVHLQSGGHDLGLVPLLDKPFNRGRAPVKVLEMMAIGCQGILSRRAPYASYEGRPGIHLVDDDPQAWVDAVVRVARSLET
jgi:hypothetical protein